MLIPISVTSIGNSAFAMCSNLSRLNIPNSVSYIGEGAFFSCGLKNIVMPSSLKKIEDDTFAYSIYNHRTTKTNQKYPSVNL